MTRMRVPNNIAGVVTAALLFVAGCCAANAAEVIIKPNKTNKAASDIFIKQTPKSIPTKFLTITCVNYHYHPAEYVNGSLYIIRRPGGYDAYKTNPNWTDELWRYTRDGKGIKLFSARGLDFRVKSDDSLIAVLTASEKDNYMQSLRLLAKDGRLVKFVPRKDLASADPDFLKWEGKILWLTDMDESTILALIKLDTHSMKIEKWDVSRLDVECTEADFNTSSLRLAYSDYPILFDVDSERDFVKTKSPVKLYVYDLKTKHRRLVAKSITKPFMAKWINSTTLEYDNPEGKGRIRRQL